MDENTKQEPAEPEKEAAEAEAAAPAEEPKEEPKAQPEETQPEEPSEPSDKDVDIEQYSRERYPAQPRGDDRKIVDEVAKELSQLPTDEYGNVDSNVAAQWFANKFQQVETRAERRAIEAAQEAVMGNISEYSQQQQLLEKYPEIKKDKTLMEDVFDKRDAAALRGEGLTLLQAAERVMGRNAQARSEGAKSATRQTQIQAAAHLEPTTTKGQTDDFSELAQTAVYGSGDNAKAARQAMLRQFVEKEVKEGRIQAP